MALLKRSKKKAPSIRRPTRVGSNSSSVEKVQLGVKHRVLSRGFLTICLISLGVLLLVSLAVLWFAKVYADPQHVFWATLDGNLASQSITKDSVKASGTSTSHDYVQVAFTPELRVHDLKEVTDNSTKPASKLTLETIGTIDTDYQRYSYIERPKSTKTQKDYQRVYDAWLKNGGQEGGSGQIVGNSLFGAVLYGDFSAATRANLINELKQAYQVDFSSVSSQAGIERRTYVYPATITLQRYSVAARDYARALGLPFAERIDPRNYQPTDKLKVSITINVLSRQIKKIDYAGQSFTENYSGQGNVANIKPPAKTVSAATFEQALRSISQ